MKKYLYSLLILVAFTACDDQIDLEQPGRLGEAEAFETVADLESGMLSVYNELDYSQAIQFNAVFTDQVRIGRDSGGQGIGNGEYGFRLNPSSAAATAMWNNHYRVLNAATRVIEGAALITPADEDEQAIYDDVLAQCYALRAFAHFELLTYWSPDLTDDSAPGVIILNFIPSVEDVLNRNTTGEVFAAINADLQIATDLIQRESDPLFISEDFITALRARMAAYRGQYAQADGFAATLLENYPLATRTEYRDIFTDESNAEIIFKLGRVIGDDYDGQGVTGSGFAGGWAGANFAFVNSTIDGSPYFEMSTSLFNELNQEDIRFEVLLDPTRDLDRDILPIGKYPGADSQPLKNDLKIFRSSEMLFIRAEAAAAANNPSGAANYIQSLLDARYGGADLAPQVSYPNATAAFAGILEQRRLELAYEGFRWVDIKRLGARAGISGIVRAPVDCEINSACSLPLSDITLQAFPIPLIELNANDVIEQTAGY